MRTLGIAALSLWAGSGYADVPTAQQECVQRNLAVCQFPSGVRTTQPGPCPPGSETLKPQGAEECGVFRTSTPAIPAYAPPPAESQSPAAHPSATAGVERWLTTSLICGLAGVVLLWTLWRMNRRLKREALPPRSGALAWCVCATAGALVGWKAASVAFRHAIDSYDNHDSAAPLLLASPVWLVTFAAVSTAVCALLLRGVRYLKGRSAA
ncbi:MAG: hypothetical protein U0900_06035 [Myxococcota bacterium]